MRLPQPPGTAGEPDALDGRRAAPGGPAPERSPDGIAPPARGEIVPIQPAGITFAPRRGRKIHITAAGVGVVVPAFPGPDPRRPMARAGGGRDRAGGAEEPGTTAGGRSARAGR